MEADRPAVDGMTVALTALSRKERTVREMRELLEDRGVDAEEIERVTEDLLENGALNDAEFARRYAADKRSLAYWGNERIRRVLTKRGIEPAEIEAALAEDEGEEVERAISALSSRTFDLTEERDRVRALRFLGQRGYRHETAYEAIRRRAT